jgi:polyisoprenyl-teichoic acid--peptidoglycan teichoic acid transferase
VAAACSTASWSGAKRIGDVTERPKPEPTTTTTTEPPPPPVTHIIDVVLEGDPDAADAVGAVYAWLGDRSLPRPDVPPGLLSHLGTIRTDRHMTVRASLHAADVGDEGRVAVVTADDDVVLLADEGSGWQVVGASLARFGSAPWYGEPIRHVLVIGTDARVGQSQPVFRADGIHILASNLEEGGGGIVNIPRDAYVRASYGMDKFSSVNARSDRHADEMLDVARDLSGLPIEGYLLTGFLGFMRLVDAFGGVVVNVPYRMDDWRAEADLFPGVQRLRGADLLAFTRVRSIPGGDFTRTRHHGVVMLAALAELAGRDITHLPGLVAILSRNTWTDLPLGDLLTLTAVAFEIDPDRVTNVVLPGTVQLVRGASVVLLDEERAAEIFEDLADGMLSPSS